MRQLSRAIRVCIGWTILFALPAVAADIIGSAQDGKFVRDT